VTIDQADCWPLEHWVLDAFDAAALVVDPRGDVIEFNNIAEELLARPDRGLAGAGLFVSILTEAGSTAGDLVLSQVLRGLSWSGRAEVLCSDGSRRSLDVSCLPLSRGGVVDGLLCLVKAPLGDHGERQQTRQLKDGLTRLARVTAQLVIADSVEAVIKVVTYHSADAVGATIASLTLRDGESLRFVGLRGGREGDAQKWASYSIDTPTPASDAIRSGQPTILVGQDAIATRYPHLDAAAYGERSIVCLPLKATGRTVGAIGLSFPGQRSLGSAEMEFLEILADTCAQALDRIRAQDEAALQTARLVFLADASAELARSLDYQVTLSKVAQLAVPNFADWCAIDLVEDGRLRRLAVAHADPAKVQVAHELHERYPSDPNSPTGAWNVMRTGRSELISEITDEMLVAGAVNEEHLRIARDLHLRSALIVPLVARGRVLGTISWVWAEAERVYTREDLAFAEDLAKRAAVAIDNAELHSETRDAAIRLQHAVLPERMPTISGWGISSYYRPAGRTEVGGDFYDAIPLDDGRLVLFVGDVMGRGVAAAAAMAQIRAAVLAYAAIDPTPDEVMGKLDLMFAQHPKEQLVTLVYMMVDVTRDELVVANAGHPPPVLLRADLSTEQLPLADGSPLGTIPQERRQTTVPFNAGDTVLAFTDGLIERRDEDIDQGQERVLRALPMLVKPDLSAALTELVERVRQPQRNDDVAALAARRLA